MCWRCDHPDRPVQDYLDELYATMPKRGWAVQYVESERRPFAYTVGLTRCDLPELLITGVSPQRAVGLLNAVAFQAVNRGAFTAGARMTLPAGSRVELVEVEHPDAHLKFATAFFGNQMSALQVVWADERGRWPWAPDFDDGRGSQPVMGVRAVCN
ncbi:DUF4262 domain-containing protein [Mycobacterium servetii]|uniref:DUF4262 domain-containing protein n=1 Tax=Mycobacterium servetii TaxID=3237418 RepID=A0ABV4C0Z0_9MYCO